MLVISLKYDKKFGDDLFNILNTGFIFRVKNEIRKDVTIWNKNLKILNLKHMYFQLSFTKLNKLLTSMHPFKTNKIKQLISYCQEQQRRIY